MKNKDREIKTILPVNLSQEIKGKKPPDFGALFKNLSPEDVHTILGVMGKKKERSQNEDLASKDEDRVTPDEKAPVNEQPITPEKLDELTRNWIQERDRLLKKLADVDEREKAYNEQQQNSQRDQDMKNNKEGQVEKLSREELEKEIEENMKGLLDKIKDKKPEIQKFKLISNPSGFVIESIVKINKTRKFLYPTATINLSIPLTNDKKGELSLGKYEIEAGLATSSVKKEIEPYLPSLLTEIKTYFESRYGKLIESLNVEDGMLAIHFKEKK